MPIYATEPLEKPSNWRCWRSRKGGERTGPRTGTWSDAQITAPLCGDSPTQRSYGYQPQLRGRDAHHPKGASTLHPDPSPSWVTGTPAAPEITHPSGGEGSASLWGSWQTQQRQLQVLPTGSATWRPTPSSQTFSTKNPEVSNNILAVHMWTEGSDRYLKKTANIKATKMEKKELGETDWHRD